MGGPIRKAAHSYYCGKVGYYCHHSYLGQLWEIADILPTYWRQRNKTRRDYRYKMVAGGHTGCDVARYNVTVWEAG